MILALRSDSPDTELYLIKNGQAQAKLLWRADRQLAKELLPKIDELLHGAAAGLKDLTGLIVYKGPGSFTGLRIGCMVMNTLAYAQELPIVGTTGNNWVNEGERLIVEGIYHGSVMPEYGAEPRITAPRK